MTELNNAHLLVRFVTDSSLKRIGTCFAISKNFYLTAKHVVDGTEDIRITDKYLSTMPGKIPTALIPAKIVWESQKYDLAVITPNDVSQNYSTPSNTLKINPSLPINYGQQVSSLGYPQPRLEKNSNTVEAIILRSFNGNIVSNIFEECPVYKYPSPLYEVSFPILDGHSGAPILAGDAAGLIGICLGSSRSYVLEESGSEENKELWHGYRFGIALNLTGVLKNESDLSQFFNPEL